MVKSMDIVDFSLSDDLPPRVVDKLNANFRRLARIIYHEEPSQHDILQIDLPIPVESGGTGTASFHEGAIVIGNGSDPLTEVVQGAGYLYSSGGTPYWRDAEMGDSNWFGNGTPTGTRDPSSSWTTEQAKSDHAGDLYWSTASSGAVWYWAKTGSPAAWKWNQLSISGGSGNYNNLTNKPTITEADLGIIGSGSNRTFGPTGTSTTVTIQGDNSQAGYQDIPFTTTEIDVIIQMAERAGAI